MTTPNDGVTLVYNQKTYHDLFLLLANTAYSKGLLSDDSSFMNYVNRLEKIENTELQNYDVIAQIVQDAVYTNLYMNWIAKDLSKATGTALDYLLEGLIERYPASYATTEITFGKNTPASEDIPIPYGTAIKSSVYENIVFTTTEAVTLYTGETTIIATAICTTIGPTGNVPALDLNAFADEEISGIDYVSNLYAATGGKDVEDDNSFRNRGLSWKYIVEKGTYAAVVNAITSIPAIEGYNIDPYWNGYGTTRITIDPPLESLITLLENALVSVKAVDEDITVVGVTEVTVNLVSTINVNIDRSVPLSSANLDILANQIESYLRVYMDGGFNRDGSVYPGMQIGQDFIPFQAAKYVTDQIPELNNSNITFTYPTEPVTILANERATCGTVYVSVE